MFIQRFSGKLRLLTLALTLSFSFTLALPLTASAHTRHGDNGFFEQTNLVSDLPGVAQRQDTNLVNPWGIVAFPDGPFWIADNGTGLATAYNGDGRKAHKPITIPPPSVTPGATAAPTGVVLNNTDDFVIKEDNGKPRPATLLFATEDGTISGWNPKVDRTHAILEVDNTNTMMTGPVYKGLALGSNEHGNFLFATNFRFGEVDVFNSQFQQVKTFTDTTLPPGYAPFGIRNIGGKLFVTFALQDDKKHDDVAGPGNGFVDIFDTNGNFVRRLISHGPSLSPLNSPWGLVVAPDNFGPFSNDLLVGNFGAGKFNAPSVDAFDLNGNFQGNIKDEAGNAITINGLWGLTFSHDTRAAEPDDLYFTAGINDEANGLFGFLSAED